MLKSVVKKGLVRVGHELRGSTLFIDGTIAEALAWTFADDAGGVLGLMMSLGVTNMFSLDDFASQSASTALAAKSTQQLRSDETASGDGHHESESAPSPQKVVFMVGRYLWEAWDLIKRALRRIEQYGLGGTEEHDEHQLRETRISRVVVLCAVDQLAHSVRPDVCPPENPYQFYERQLRDQFELLESATKPSTCVDYIPVVCAVISPENGGIRGDGLGVFTLPACSSAFPAPLRYCVQDEEPSKIQWESLPRSIKGELTMVIQGLAAFLSLLNIKEDVYALGSTSRVICEKLMAAPRHNSSTAREPRSASLIVIDRTLDLARVCMHNSDNLMERVFALLPHATHFTAASASSDGSSTEAAAATTAPMQSSDVLVDTSCLAAPSTSPLPGFGLESTSLAGDGDRRWLYGLMCLTAKDGLAELQNALEQAIQSCCLEIEDAPIEEAPARGAPSASKQLHQARRIMALVRVLQSDESAMQYHYPLLVIAAAVAAALMRANELQWDELVAVEKVLQLTISSQSPVLQLTDLLSRPIAGYSRSEYYSVRQVMRLALVAFSLLAPDSDSISYQETHTLQQALLSSLFSRPQRERIVWLPRYLEETLNRRQEQWHQPKASGSSDTAKADDGDESQFVEMQMRLEVEDAISAAVEHLKSLQQARSSLQDYRNLLSGGAKGTASYRPLLQQVCHSLFDDGRDLHDLQALNERGLSGLLGGFSRFAFQAKKRPTDNTTIILFVVGGISSQEIADISAAVPRDRGFEFMVGSTQLLNADRLYDLIFQLPSE